MASFTGPGGGAKSLAPLPGTVGSSSVTDSDLAQAEQLVNEGAQSKYAEQPSAAHEKRARRSARCSVARAQSAPLLPLPRLARFRTSAATSAASSPVWS